MEFTVENGVLFILQTRTGKRTARAAVAIAVKMVEERLITEREAVCRIHPSQMDFFLHPMIDPDFFKSKAAVECLVGKGLAASAGAAIGKLAFDCKKAEAMAKKGERSILCRHDTSADDISGMFCSEGAITIHGGLTSHAAVVMRGMGKPAVTGARNMQVNYQKKQLIGEDIKGSLFVLKEGDTVTVDGSTGCVYSGSMPTVFSGEVKSKEITDTRIYIHDTHYTHYTHHTQNTHYTHYIHHTHYSTLYTVYTVYTLYTR